MSTVEVAAQMNATLGECPVWDVETQRLHLVDILARKIHQLDPATGALTSIATRDEPGAIVLCENGGYLAGIGLDFTIVGTDGTTRTIARAERGTRLNDAKVDARGRVLSGTMDGDRRTGMASLYSLDPAGVLTELRSDVTVSNGFDWNESGDILYYVDTPTERVDAIEYDVNTGLLGTRRTFADLTAVTGRPDGLTVDAEGGVWVAVARGGAVHRYDRTGRLDAVIKIPTMGVTSCTFGGRNLDALFVTTARALLAEPARTEDPLGGAVFVVAGLGVRGRAPNRYGSNISART